MRALWDVPAPAKLNLFLHITGRRDDGYHLLQSAFMLIDWCDTLHFERREGGALSREDLTTALPADDLILRAARALQSATGCTIGAHIQVHKRIPAQAGMGGGSSDAATVLLGLNRLWQTKLPNKELQRLGLQLGADVPFFLFGRNAWVEGIGEKLQALDLPLARFVVLKPAAGIETAAIFSAPDLPRATPSVCPHDFMQAQQPFAFGRNDLQVPAMRLYPDIGYATQWLASHGLQPRMTGSGSAVFARTGAVASPMATSWPDLPAGWVGRMCRSLDQHPLVDWAGGGASIPLTGWGNTIAKGTREAVAEKGIFGALSGGLTGSAAGVAAAIFFGFLIAVAFKPKNKEGGSELPFF